MTACSRERHDELRADPELWERETYFVGMQEVPEEEPLALYNCRTCHSTICRRDP